MAKGAKADIDPQVQELLDLFLKHQRQRLLAADEAVATGHWGDAVRYLDDAALYCETCYQNFTKMTRPNESLLEGWLSNIAPKQRYIVNASISDDCRVTVNFELEIDHDALRAQ